MLSIWHIGRSLGVAFGGMTTDAPYKRSYGFLRREACHGGLPSLARKGRWTKHGSDVVLLSGGLSLCLFSGHSGRRAAPHKLPQTGMPHGKGTVRMKEKSIHMAKCVLVYCLGLFIMAMGVSFSGTADLGMSPVNSIPYVLSEIFTALSMGTWIIIIFSLYILIQFVIFGRDFQPWRILQLICTTLFGYFTDFTNFLADCFLPDPAQMPFSPAVVYGVRLLYLFISMVLIALGILFYLAPNLISLPGEDIMQVIAHKLDKPLPVIKMCFDCTVSLIALAISLAYFRQFHGIREGTVIAAFGVGKILGLYEPLKPALHRFMHGLEAEEAL